MSSINSIIQLRDGNIASASSDHAIKIWHLKLKNDKYEYSCIDKLTEYGHAMFKLIQLKDDRLCATTNKGCAIIIWRNRSDSY